MDKFMLGKKIGMTQVFTEDGLMVPVTVIEAGPCVVVQVKTLENEGYNSIKVGFADIAEKRLNKPDKGQFAKSSLPFKRHLKEFKVQDTSTYEVGKQILVSDVFKVGDKADFTGISKGKGFQSTIKRYNQSGGKATHGSMYHRRPGSMGANSDPSKVFKGKKLPGHMGNEKVTVQNLTVLKVDADKNLLIVKGSIPGPKGALIVIKDSVKVS